MTITFLRPDSSAGYFEEYFSDTADNTTWYRLWTGDSDGSNGNYVDTSSFNSSGDGWIAIDDLPGLEVDFAQADDSVLWVLPYSSTGETGSWTHGAVDFSEAATDDITSVISEDTPMDRMFTNRNEDPDTWYRLWIGDSSGKNGSYLDNSALNSYKNGWISSDSLDRVSFKVSDAGQDLWVRTWTPQADYGWEHWSVEGADDCASDTSTDRTVAPGDSVTGELECAGDSDWFAVSLDSSYTYTIDLEGSFTGRGTLKDPYLYLKDADGNAVAEDDDGGSGRNARIEDFSPEKSGMYYIDVQGYYDDATGTYTVSLSEKKDDYAADATTRGGLSPGGSTGGELETDDDEDWFKIHLSEGISYEFTLTGYEGAQHPLINLYDSAQDTIPAEKSSNGSLRFTPDADGTFYIGVEDPSYINLTPLAYTLHAAAEDTIYVGSSHDTYPYSAVTYIEATFPSGETYTGSGAVVGRNDVLTASHVIYSVDEGGLAEEVNVYPALDGSDSPFGSYEWDFVNYFEVDLDGDNQMYKSDSENDLAVIGFDQPLGDETGWFGLDGSGTSGNYNLTGYPQIYADESGPKMTNDYGYVSKETNSVFNYDSLESNPGNSGGPLWYSSDTQGPFVAGVASTTQWAAGIDLHYDTITGWIQDNDHILDDPLSNTAWSAAGTPLEGPHTELEIMGVGNFENGGIAETQLFGSS